APIAMPGATNAITETQSDIPRSPSMASLARFNVPPLRTGAAMIMSLVVWFSAVSAAHGATLDEIKKRGYIVVATEDDYRPFEFVEGNKPTGFDNEMVDALEKYAP